MANFRSFHRNLSRENGNAIQLRSEESHHLVNVLRAKKGDTVYLIDGKGLKWVGELQDTDPKNAQVLIKEKLPHEVKRNTEIILAQALPKGKGLEAIIQKATEIGVDRIIPLNTKRTEVKFDDEWKEKKLERWESIAIEACKQSGNLYFPTIDYITEFKDILRYTADLKLVASLEKDVNPLNHYLDGGKIPKHIIWIVGPEGDFTAEEYSLAKDHDFQPVTLSKNIMRVETAAIYALSITDYELRKRN